MQNPSVGSTIQTRTDHDERVMQVEGPAGRARHARPQRGRGGALVVALAFLLAVSLWFAGAADAELARAGPVDPKTGLPGWLEDTQGLRLEPCTEGTYCSPGARGSVLYWSAAATVPTRDGGHSSLVLSTQGDAPPSDGPSTGGRVFNRIRITADNLVPGATYRVIHPYGTETFTDVHGGSKSIDFTEDVGCLQAPCGGFRAALNGRVGPWLTWDTSSTSAGESPAGHIGDATTPHKVLGSPLIDDGGNQQNYFEIRGPDIGGPGVGRVRTDLFTVEGKVARLTVFASPRGGLYPEETMPVTLSASDPDAEIFYTTDGTEPTPSSTRYRGPIALSATTTLKFMAVTPGGGELRRSPIFTQTYTVGSR
jgi:Chitobiase/beta-hexosaminidase C-terminal domain